MIMTKNKLPKEDFEEQPQSSDETLGGSAQGLETDDDTEEMIEAVIGNKPEPGKPFSIAEEVEKDEKARRLLDNEEQDKQAEEDESEEEDEFDE